MIILSLVYIRDHGTRNYGPEGRQLAEKTEFVSRIKQFEHSKMCIDHITGFKLEQKKESKDCGLSQFMEESLPENDDTLSASSSLDLSLIKCYDGPGHVNEQRKFKRRCMGIHTYPILFDR